MFRPRATLAAAAAMAAVPFSLPAAAQDFSLSDITEAWLDGPHGDYRSRSFTYWNDEGEVPAACAACHSETGMLDYLGHDGSAALSVEHPATINTVIGCASCHTSAGHAPDAVPFPSGVTMPDLGGNATCYVCHQGRHAGDDVAAAVAEIEEDVVSAELSFINVHYGVAAAVTHGAETRGGYEYEGRDYAGTYAHVPSAHSCLDCHDAHDTEVAVEGCLSCHQGVDDLREIRMRHADFDGDGSTVGGIHAEIIGLHRQLDAAIRTYAEEVVGTPIGYAPGRFPYFFTDTDGDGKIGEGEAIFPNRYANWTPRLLKAAYNYQFVAKDPGAYVHNPAYALQLLHDSLESLAEREEIDFVPGRLPRR
ncbi:MAG: polyheme membrane-associated cytochrome C [Rhodosalinus sp.]